MVRTHASLDAGAQRKPHCTRLVSSRRKANHSGHARAIMFSMEYASAGERRRRLPTSSRQPWEFGLLSTRPVNCFGFIVACRSVLRRMQLQGRASLRRTCQVARSQQHILCGQPGPHYDDSADRVHLGSRDSSTIQLVDQMRRAITRWAPTFIRAPVLLHSLHHSSLPRDHIAFRP